MASKRPPLKASFLAPGARQAPISTSAACPDCKSTEVVFLLHPNTCELVLMLDHTLMKCVACGGEFAADYVAALAALTLKNPSGTIGEDLICPECRDSIQGQRAGKPCRSCGNVILEHMAMSRRRSRGVNPWRIIVPVLAAMLAIGAVYQFAPKPWGLVSFVWVLGAVEFWQGVNGLVTRRVEERKGMTLRVHRGGKAVMKSVLHLIIAGVFLVVGWAILQGWFER